MVRTWRNGGGTWLPPTNEGDVNKYDCCVFPTLQSFPSLLLLDQLFSAYRIQFPSGPWDFPLSLNDVIDNDIILAPQF